MIPTGTASRNWDSRLSLSRRVSSTCFWAVMSVTTRQMTVVPSMSRQLAASTTGSGPSGPTRCTSTRDRLTTDTASKRGKQRPVGTDQQVGERRADQTGRATPEHLAQPGIRVQDDAARGDRRRALVHLFDDQPVGSVGAAEGVDLLGAGFAADHRVDAAQPDRFQDIPEIADLVPQRPVLRVDQLVGDVGHGLPVPGRDAAMETDLQRLPDAVRIGEVADQAPHRFGPPFDQGGCDVARCPAAPVRARRGCPAPGSRPSRRGPRRRSAGRSRSPPPNAARPR